jgi:hypothetical protein
MRRFFIVGQGNFAFQLAKMKKKEQFTNFGHDFGLNEPKV